MSWDPFEELKRVRQEISQEIDRVFSEVMGRFRPRPVSRGEYVEPAIDIYETGEEVVVVANLPGAGKEDIRVEATESALEIKAEAKAQPAKDVTYHRRERPAQGYARMVELPCKVEPAGAKASYSEGVLEVRLPKKEKLRKVSIKPE